MIREIEEEYLDSIKIETEMKDLKAKGIILAR